MVEQLPQELWALILQHVSQVDRLGRCALVSTTLSTAATATTDALQVSLQDSSSQSQQQQRAEALDSYLLHHGGHVTSLVYSAEQQALALLPCPQLVHLDLSHVSRMQLGPHGSLPGVLPSLTHLTRLALLDIGGVEDVDDVSCLTNLSTLRLKLAASSPRVRLAATSAPGFVLPASLQELALYYGVVFEPALLSTATRLTRVVLSGARLEGPGGGVSGGAALLAAVAGLQHLAVLDLRCLDSVGWPAPSPAFTALTASSKLQTLTVQYCGLPEAVWEHALTPGRCCPTVREFRVCDDPYLSFSEVLPWDAGAVSSLVGCCPGLRALGIWFEGGPAVAALQPLTALTWLDASVDCDDAADVSSSVAATASLANLQQLDLSLLVAHEAYTDAVAAGAGQALLPLIALRQLSDCTIRLGLAWHADKTVSLRVLNKAGPGRPPDVWLQLVEECQRLSDGSRGLAAWCRGRVRRLLDYVLGR